MANDGRDMAILDLNGPPDPDYFSSQVRQARRFFHPGLETAALPYRVISGGMEICIPGYRIQRSRFPYWAVEFVVSGRGSAVLDGTAHDIGPGAVYAYGPGMPHRIAADRSEPLEKYFVDVLPASRPPESFAVVRDRIGGEVVHSTAPEALRHSFEELIRYGGESGTASPRICSALVDLILLKIADGSTDHSMHESAAYGSYRRCRGIIDSRFLEFRSIDEVAREANMDVSYLCRLFKRYAADTPYRILSRLRMNHAAGRLTRDRLSVKSTAMELGYDDPFTFSRKFKSVMGLSPRSFVGRYTETAAR